MKTAITAALLPLFFAIPALAKRPDLDAVVMGTLKHNNTAALRPVFLGQITVSAWQNGVKLAEMAVPPSAAPDPSRYVLKIPIDDGAEPRLPGTARRGERIRVKVRNISTNLEYEVNETEATAGLALSSTKGAIQLQNLSLDQNLGGASNLQARYALWKAERNYQPDLLDSDMDCDGDGQSNFAEFLANTDPLSGSVTLRIRQLRRSQGVTSVQFGPTRSDRKYAIYASRTMLSGDWQKVAEFTAAADAETQWLDHVSGGSSLFYRVEVSLP